VVSSKKLKQAAARRAKLRAVAASDDDDGEDYVDDDDDAAAASAGKRLPARPRRVIANFDADSDSDAASPDEDTYDDGSFNAVPAPKNARAAAPVRRRRGETTEARRLRAAEKQADIDFIVGSDEEEEEAAASSSEEEEPWAPPPEVLGKRRSALREKQERREAARARREQEKAEKRARREAEKKAKKEEKKRRKNLKPPEVRSAADGPMSAAEAALAWDAVNTALLEILRRDLEEGESEAKLAALKKESGTPLFQKCLESRFKTFRDAAASTWAEGGGGGDDDDDRARAARALGCAEHAMYVDFVVAALQAKAARKAIHLEEKLLQHVREATAALGGAGLGLGDVFDAESFSGVRKAYEKLFVIAPSWRQSLLG